MLYRVYFFAFFLFFLGIFGKASSLTAKPGAHKSNQLHRMENLDEYSSVSMAYRLLDIAQEATARDVAKFGARPTVQSRTLAIWATAVYDAWAAYDDRAVGSRLGSSLRQSKKLQTLENKQKAIIFASFHALYFVYPEQRDYLKKELKKLGYADFKDVKSLKGPAAIGVKAAQAVIDYRKNDGANQLGNEIGSNGEPYSDYTYYKPVNTESQIVDPNRWQPIRFVREDGSSHVPGFLTPHWYRVKPFLMSSSDQFRPEPPPTTLTNDTFLKAQTEKIVQYNANLTNKQKAMVEFMRDGPRSTGQSGHWMRFAQDVSRRDKLSLDEDVKLYFVVANVAFDAFIACWETKRYYDSSRPWTLVRHYYKGQKIKAWGGVDGGTKMVSANDWYPYSPRAFVTPPFPGYTSGHATVSGASARILEHFTGSKRYGFTERRPHCALTEKLAGDMIDLKIETWDDAAELAAKSRALGGYHIEVDNDKGLEMGRKLADWSWPRYRSYFEGSLKEDPTAH